MIAEESVVSLTIALDEEVLVFVSIFVAADGSIFLVFCLLAGVEHAMIIMLMNKPHINNFPMTLHL